MKAFPAAFVAFLSACSSSVPPVIEHAGPQPISIHAKTYWNDTSISLRQGHRYLLNVSGKWTDWTYPADAAGPISRWDNALMFPLRPLLRYSPLQDRRANYFQAIGSIGRGEGKKLSQYAFIIEDRMIYTAPASGILNVFANDAPFAYWNNKGELHITITEIR